MTALDAMGTCPLGPGHETHPPGWCCGAKLKQRDGFDQRRAGWGTDHVGVGPCKLHLGSTRNHRVAARKMLAERGAATSLAEQGYEPIGHPVDELLDLAAKVKALMGHWAAKVAELQGVEGEGIRYRSEHEQEQLRSEVALYERSIDRLGRLLTDLAKLGLEERRTRLEEADRERVVAILVEGFDGLFEVLAGLVPAAVLEGLRRDELPGIVRAAIEATATEAS